MNEDLTALCKRLLHRVQTNTTDLADEPHIEPATSFTDPKRFAAERRHFFIDTPQVVGFAGELAKPNSYKAVSVLGRPILICRDKDGALRAFINACKHRGAQLAQGEGCTRALSCPFHGWTYSLNGELIGRRQAESFLNDAQQELIDTRLTELAVSDRGGLLTVAADIGVAQQTVDLFLDDIERALKSFPFGDMQSLSSGCFEVDANWKLVVNLSNEGYHFENLHRTSLAPFMTSHGVVDYFGPHTRWGFSMKSISDLAELKESEWPTHFPGSVNHTLFPGTVIVGVPGAAQLIRVEPGDSPGKSLVHYANVFYPEGDAETIEAARKATQESFEFGENIFVNEDLEAARQCQRGIEAGGLQELICGRNEPLVCYWHKLWNEKLSSTLNENALQA